MRELPTGTVTFLFSDIEGSTRLVEASGAGFGALLARHQDILRSCWREHQGIEVSTDGDAFFVVFEDAVEAVAAAACVQQRMAAEAWPLGHPVRVRIGIHTGRGTRGGDNYVGMDVHRAARIASAGHGGQVLLSEATTRVIGRDLPIGASLRDLGAHRLKDLAEPEHIAQLVVPELIDEFPAIRSIDARPTNLPPADTPLLGREGDLERIRRLLETSRLVTLTGPGGVGKTSLALAAARSMRDRFPDGVFVSWLASVNDPARLPSAIGGPIGVQESGDRPARDLLLDQLREREMLLVLDNFEHLAEEAGYVSELLQAAPGLRLVVTSQTVLPCREALVCQQRVRSPHLGGRPMEAEPYYQGALARLAKLGDRSGVAVELDMLAVVAVDLADPIRALRLAGAAAGIRDAIGAGQLLEMQVYRDPVEMLRGRIDDAQASDAVAEGRSWSLAAAVAYANRSDSDFAADEPTAAVRQ